MSRADVVERFFEWAGREGADKKLIGRGYSHRIKTFHGDTRTLYSYGAHFPLVTVIGDRDAGDAWWLLNGDTYSSTTTKHQSQVRAAAERSSMPSCIIPFSALRAAGIDSDSIELVEVLPDTYTTETHKAYNLDDVPEFHRMQWVDGKYIDIQPNEDGVYVWTTQEHHLGGSLIRASYHEMTTKKCKGHVGDNTCKHGQWAEHFIMKRTTALFLSSFDQQESTPLYFFAQLPAESEATTVAQAYEDLKPVSVQKADIVGIPYVRQGDIFAIESTLDRRDLKGMGATFEKRKIETRVEKYSWGGERIDKIKVGGKVLDTDHAATEIAVLEDGTTYARGCLYHDAQWRSDHARRKMGDGKTWHFIEKNTVPQRSDRSPRAWTIGGGVD